MRDLYGLQLNLLLEVSGQISKSLPLRRRDNALAFAVGSIKEKGRDPIFHLLYDGAPARFLRNHLKNYARRVLGQSFSININSIVLNEVPLDIVRRCDSHTLRRWYTIINVFKTALYALYYRRSLFDRNGIGIIRTFNHHLRAVKKAAEERKSDILDSMWFIPEKDDSVLPFYKILNEIH